MRAHDVFFLEPPARSHLRFNQCCRQMGTPPPQRLQVGLFIVWLTVFPAAEYDANPLKRQRSHSRMVSTAFRSLVIVIGPRPDGLPNRVRGPFMKGLPQELGAGIAEVNPIAFAAPLPHRWKAC